MTEVSKDRVDALDAVIGLLACPLCGATLEHDSAVRCAHGHSFDVARQGYVSFLVGSAPHVGDSADMVEARSRFLAAGHYAPIAAAVSRAVPPEARFIADIAAGTGYYLAAALEARPRARGIALDVSSPAARRAVRAHACAAAATADAWKRLPIADGTVDAALTVFGPRNGQELVRVLTPDGVAIVVTPNASHMTELRERFGLIGIQHDKDARLESQFAGLRLVGREPVDYDIQLTPEDAANEIFMGPSAFHLDRDAVTEQLGDTTSRVTVSVTVSVFSA